MHFGERLSELIPCDRLAPDTNALGRLHQMRGRVKPGANTGGAESGFDHGASGSLPVGSGHMDESAGAMRVAQSLEQPRDPHQIELGGLNLVAKRVKKVNR